MRDESCAAYEVFCNFTTLKNACRIKIHFYWINTSVPFPRELAKMHFYAVCAMADTVRCIAA